MNISTVILTRLRLVLLLRRHIKISERRSPVWEQNKASKYILWFSMSFVFLYLIMLAVMLAVTANGSDDITSYELMYGLVPFILIIDFISRFLIQQTPSQMVKPYVMLPIPCHACIDSFIISSIMSAGNLVWFIMLIPYALMSVVFSYGVVHTIAFLAGFYLMILANSLWYMLVRSLIRKNLCWWLLPLAVYAILMLPCYATETPDIEKLFGFYASIGYDITHLYPIPFIVVISLFILLFMINSSVQYKLVWYELSEDNGTTSLKHVSKMSFFNRWGVIGEFMKLDLKSIMRNNNIRGAVITSLIITTIFSLLMSFTDIYDSAFMTNLLCLYCFVIFGEMLLTKVMCHEGNYIDILMVHKEDILSLLKAKYAMFCTLLIVPFILLIPTLVTGKCTLLMLISYAMFTAGPMYCIFFQMAVYNKQTLPLNSRYIGKGASDSNYTQLLINLLGFGIPISIMNVLEALTGTATAYTIMMIIGITFIVTNGVWMRNIYVRMMKRKYANLESFRATR